MVKLICMIWLGVHLFVCLLLQNDADYWLLSDAEVSITDMWKTDGISIVFLFFLFLFLLFFNIILCLLWMLNSCTPTIAPAEWTGMDMLHADFGVADISTPIQQTSLSGITEVPSTIANSSQRWMNSDLPNVLNQETHVYVPIATFMSLNHC